MTATLDFESKRCNNPRCEATPEEPHLWRDTEDGRLKSCEGGEVDR